MALTPWILAATMALTPVAGTHVPKRIDVDCESARALERALARARWHREIDIYLHGVCTGNFVISGDGVTLRGATRDSGLAAPDGSPGWLPVLEVADAKASLRGLIVQGGSVGVLVEGWDAEVLLYEVDVHEQEVGVIASRGARARLVDTTLRDSSIGIAAETNSTLNLQNVTVTDNRDGIVVVNNSFAAINDTRIANNSQVGLNVVDRSDVNVLGGVFRDNGQVHINANDFSSIRLLYDVTIGSETDSTPFALGANRQSTIASFTTPAIYGDVSALVNASIQMGNTVVHGDLTLIQFATAYLRDLEIAGVLACVDGADAICKRTTTGGTFDCPSTTCNSTAPGADGRAPVLPDYPEIESPIQGQTPAGLRSRPALSQPSPLLSSPSTKSTR